MKKKITIGLLIFVSVLSPSFAQTIWTDGGGDNSWLNTANWNPGAVPISTTAVQIGTQPTGNFVGIDTGGPTTVASFTFNNTLTAPVDVAPLATETLQVNGAITNNSTFTDSFSLGVIAGASAVWSGPLNFTSPVAIGTNTITLSNTITFSGLSFDITSASTYGRFLGAGTATVTGATINITGAYAGVVNDTFDLTTGNFSGATLGTLPTLSGSLTWNTSAFLTTGVLTVVPEPATWALLAGSLTTVMVFRRRRLSV